MVKDLTKQKMVRTRTYGESRAYRMRFPILKYLALKTEPVTAYELEKTKFDIVRDGKNMKGWIDKPTIYDTLKLMEDYKEVELTERKVCKGGRVRKKYLVTRRGIATILSSGYRDPEYVEISNRYVRQLAEKQKSSFPRVFDLWPEFVREGVEDLACHKLMDACRLAILSNTETSFFNLIVNDLKGGEDPFMRTVNESERKSWFEVVSRNDGIRKVLVDLIIHQASESVGQANETLKLLSVPELQVGLPEEAALKVMQNAPLVLRVLKLMEKRNIRAVDPPLEQTKGNEK